MKNLIVAVLMKDVIVASFNEEFGCGLF